MSEIRVDTISEKTSANGVAVDGVTLKDGGLTTTAAVGIGTASPSKLLSLKSDGSGGAIGIDIHNEGTNSADDAIITFETQGHRNYSMGIDRSASSFVVMSEADGLGTARLTIDDSGDAIFSGTVGVPALDIMSGSSIHGTITTSSSSLTLNARNTGNMLFQSGGSEKMRIMSDGDIGIGTTAPTQNLELVVSKTASIPTNQAVGSTDNGAACGMGIHNENDSAAYSGIALETRTSGASRWLIANEWQSTYNGDLVFRNRNGATTSTEVMRLTSGGIAIGGTGAANTLDDYEEGTWTPTLSSNATAAAYSLQVGVYTKIGRMVHVSCQVQMSDLGSFAGATINVNGLPFTSANNSVDTIGVLQLNATAIATSPDIHVRIPANNAYARLENASGATTTDNNMNANRLDTGTRVRFTAVYSI